MTSQRPTTSNQCWNKFLYVKVGNFNVHRNNVRQCRNNVVIFNVDLHNVGKHWNNVVNMTIWKKQTPRQIQNKVLELQRKIIWTWYTALRIFFTLFSIFTGICRRTLAKARKLFKYREYTDLQKLYLKHLLWSGFWLH